MDLLNKEDLNNKNLAEDLDDEELVKIAKDVINGYHTDARSRVEWEDEYKKHIELALQVCQKKTHPWTNASNVKFPLLSTAAMQFAARSYPTLIPADGKVVKCKVVGSDPDGSKFKRAKNISTHMSYQVMEEMVEWEEEMDKLLLVLPIVGMAYKKTYWDSEKQRNCSHLVLPDKLVVNYWTRTLEDSERVTEVILKSKRKMQECINLGYYLDAKLGDPQNVQIKKIELGNIHQMHQSQLDETTPYMLLEQHTYHDLDGDGYPEPYITTVDYNSEKVLRIVARFEQEDVQTNDKGDIAKIEPTQYYTKFSFIPNPDGSFYDIGFGKLLGPLNASVDTIINQLIDAGTLSNLQSGFIGKGLRLKMAETKFQPGEWKAVNATGDDLRKQIVPLPANPPSDVLFKLLELLSQEVKQLASVADIMVGKMPGQNTPAYTTQQTVEQGQKLFTAVYKRVYRSLKKEFQKLYKLNAIYLNPQEENDILDDPNFGQGDYKAGSPNDVVPMADPSASSQTEKMSKAQQLAQMLQLGTLDPQKITMMFLEAMELDNPEQYINQQPPPPDPKMQAIQAKAQTDQMKAQAQVGHMQLKAQLEAQAQMFDQKMAEQKQQADLQYEALLAQIKGQHIATQANIDIANAVQSHQQKTQQNQEIHSQKMANMKEMAAHKAAQTKKE